MLRRNCLRTHIIEGKIHGRMEVTGIRGRRRKQLMNDLTEMTGCWKLKAEALDRTLWRTRFGMFYAPAARQTKERKLCFYSQ